MNDIAAFLGRYQPFAGADPSELEQLAAGAKVLSPDAGSVILAEDGAVSTGVYVVRQGAVELVHDDEVVDVLDVGEVFGHPSMLTGQAPAFTVRAREQCELILIPAREAVPHLTGEFVASTLRARLVRAGQVVHAQGDVRTAHLGDLVHRPAPICAPTDSVREAARPKPAARSPRSPLSPQPKLKRSSTFGPTWFWVFPIYRRRLRRT